MAKKQKKSSSQSIPIRVTRAKSLLEQKEESAEPKGKMIDLAPRQKGSDISMASAQKHEDTLSKEELEELLTTGSSDTKDMTKLTKASKTRRIIFRVIGVLLVLFIVTLAGFLFFSNRTKKFGQQIMLSIDVPANVSSGDVITLSVKYQNNERVELNDTELIMQFPEGFLFQSSSPANTAPNAWTLGTLKGNAGGIVEIRGQLVGDVGSIKTFNGKLSYRPDNFNYSFEQETSTVTTISDSTLTVAIDSPLRVIPEKEFSFTVSYKNISEKDIPKLQVVIDVPDGFTANKKVPDAEKFIWKLEGLDSGAEDSVKVTGTLAGDVGTQKQFTVRAGYLDTNGTFQPQTQQTFLILLIKTGLTLSVEATPEGDLTYAQFGKSVKYEVSYTNDGDIPLTNVTLSLSLHDETASGKDATFVDWNSVTTLDKAVLQDTAIVWESKSIKELANIKPGDKGTFKVEIPLSKDAPVTKEGDTQFHIVAQASASQTSKDTNTSEAITTKSENVEIKVATQVTLQAEARYYTDSLQKIGNGPLPPSAGSETTYVIFWRITNASNDIKDVTVSTTLPADVTWIGNAKISAGNPVAFNPQTREVTWTVNRIPAGSGKLFPKIEANFSVSVTPTAAQVGQFLLLSNATMLSATDTYVSTPIPANAATLTSDLSTDPQGKGKGIVVSP